MCERYNCAETELRIQKTKISKKEFLNKLNNTNKTDCLLSRFRLHSLSMIRFNLSSAEVNENYLTVVL